MHFVVVGATTVCAQRLLLALQSGFSSSALVEPYGVWDSEPGLTVCR